MDFFLVATTTKFNISPQARLKLFPHQTGELHILGVVYNLGTIQGTMMLDGIDPSIGLQSGKDMAFP